jgi:thiol:disulfide interchange protein DsbC
MKHIKALWALTIILSMFFMIAPAHAKDMTVETAQTALKKALKTVTVLSVEPAALEGLWEVAFKSGSDFGVVYINDKADFVLIGSLLNLNSGMNFTKAKFATISKVDFSLASLEGTLIVGNPKAPMKAIVFDDPD